MTKENYVKKNFHFKISTKMIQKVSLTHLKLPLILLLIQTSSFTFQTTVNSSCPPLLCSSLITSKSHPQMFSQKNISVVSCWFFSVRWNVEWIHTLPCQMIVTGAWCIYQRPSNQSFNWESPNLDLVSNPTSLPGSQLLPMPLDVFLSIHLFNSAPPFCSS